MSEYIKIKDYFKKFPREISEKLSKEKGGNISRHFLPISI